MKKISDEVRKIISSSPMLMEMLSEDLANTTAVARRIKPTIEKNLYEEVSLSSIVMGLHRLEKISTRTPFGTQYLKKLTDITVRSKLVQYVFPNWSDIPDIIQNVTESTKNRKDVFLNFSRGIHESLLIVSEELASDVEPLLHAGKKVHKVSGLSAITLRLPEETLAIPGLYYLILKGLAHDGISLVEVMSVRTEFSILFAEKDVDRAFSTLKRLTQ